MPKQVYFPRWRRITMQVVMCVIFAGTLGLAAMVDRRLISAQQFPLTDVITDGALSFRLPSDWKNMGHPSDHIWAVRSVPDANGQIRAVTVSSQQVDRLMSPMEYLSATGKLANATPQPDSLETLDFDGFPGQMIRTVSISLGVNEQTSVVHFIACCVLPTRQAVTFDFEKTGVLDRTDTKLIDTLLEDLHISGLPLPTTGSFDLSNGINVTAPADFQVMPSTDPLRIDRMIVSGSSTGKWITAEFIPVTIPPDGTTSFVPAALANREADPRDASNIYRWLGAKTSQTSKNEWLFLPAEVPQTVIGTTRRAYLIGSPGAGGVVISMKALAPSGDDELDALWASLSDSIQTKTTGDLASLMQAGVDLAQTPPRLPAAADRYFLETRDNVPVGWSHDYSDAHGSTPIRDTWYRTWLGTLIHISQRWSVGQTSWARASREEADIDPSSQFNEIMRSVSRLGDNETTSLDVIGLHFEAVQTPKSPAFVLSSRLPDLLASVTSAPVSFWTDRFPGDPAAILTVPMVVIATPHDDYVQVQMNGSSELSRWYFKDGALDHAVLPGGLMIRPSTARDIAAAFADPRLTQGL